MAKTVLPPGTTKANLLAKCRPVEIIIDGSKFTVHPGEFSTGSVGWSLNQKLEKTLEGALGVKLQCGLNLTVIGSKDVPK